MALLVKRSKPDLLAPSVAVESNGRRTAPVKYWAVTGVLFLILQVYVGVAWLRSGTLERVPGADPSEPGWLNPLVRSAEVASVVVALVMAYVLIIRPLRRNGALSIEGLVALGCLSLAWGDPLVNFSQPMFFYNAEFVNVGSWLGSVPGVVWPNAHHMAEALWVVPWGYLWFVYAFARVGVAGRRLALVRWPKLSGAGQIAAMYLAIFLVDVVVESLLIHLQLMGYPGMPGPRFPGSESRLPLWEPLLVGTMVTPIAYLFVNLDDKGRTMAERGIDQMGVQGRRKTLVRILAIVGFCNVIFMVGYNVPFAIVGLHAQDYPQSVVKRADLRGQACGDGTGYTCDLGSELPIPRKGSVHFDPKGNLVVPPGNRLPRE